MANCYVCKKVIDDTNRSKEHILLNSIGGMLKSSELLCKTCNSKMGHGPDGELAHQFEFLSAYLQVKRDKGAIPIIKGGHTQDGTKYDLINGTQPRMAQPKFEMKFTEKGAEYQLVARDMAEMKAMLKGVKKKHSFFDVDNALLQAKTVKHRINEAITYHQTFGGKLAFRSIAKTAVNFYILHKQDAAHIEHLIEYLLGEKDLDIVKHYHPLKSIYQKEANEVIHLIHLVGEKHSKQLYCYIELFSTHSYIVVLSNNYTGKNIHTTYAYNLMTNQEVKKEVALKLSPTEVANMKTEFSDFQLVKGKFDRLMRIATKIHTDREIDNITRGAVKEIFEVKFGHEKVVTKQMIKEFSELVAHEFVKFIYRLD